MKNRVHVSKSMSKYKPTWVFVYITLCLMGFFLTQQVAVGQNRFYFDIKKGTRVEGDVSLSSGALRASGASYVMRLDNANVILGNPRDFRLNGYIKNTNPNKGELKEINFDQYYGSESLNGTVTVAQATTYTIIWIKYVACREIFNIAYYPGYKVEADIQIKIYNDGRGEFSVTVNKVKDRIGKPPSAKTGNIATGRTIPPTIMSTRRG